MNEGKKPIASRQQEWDEKRKQAEIQKKIDEFLLELNKKINILNVLKGKKDNVLTNKSDSENKEEQMIINQISGYSNKEIESLINQKEIEINAIKKQLEKLTS